MPLDTAEERADEVVSPPAGAEPIPAPSNIPALVLPPVDTVLENEIWQYRYPPFDNLFTDATSHDQPHNVESESKVNQEQFDSLPSYVLGILDPAELVDGLFQRRPFLPFRSGEFPTNRKSVADSDNIEPNDSKEAQSNNGVKRDSKNLFLGQLQSPKNVLSVPKIILESDDRWVWGGSSS